MEVLRYLLFSLAVITFSVASPTPNPKCFDDTYDLPAPRAADCTNAMVALKNDQFYTTPQVFGVDENSPRNVPIEWRHKSCLLIIDVEDGSNTDKFALSSTMPAFDALDKLCVLSKPGRGLGGYMSIGHGKSFYALVQGNPDYLPSVLTLHADPVSNNTQQTPEGSSSTDTA